MHGLKLGLHLVTAGQSKTWRNTTDPNARPSGHGEHIGQTGQAVFGQGVTQKIRIGVGQLLIENVDDDAIVPAGQLRGKFLR